MESPHLLILGTAALEICFLSADSSVEKFKKVAEHSSIFLAGR